MAIRTWRSLPISLKRIGVGGSRPDDTPRVEQLLTYLGRLIDLSESRKILVLGCGPLPRIARILINKGYTVVGVDPVAVFRRDSQGVSA